MTRLTKHTHMHQEAFPGEDISDRPLPEESVPGIIELLEGDKPSGRYQARALPKPRSSGGVQELRVVLTVADIDQASQLYHTGLGLPIVEEWAVAEGRGVILAAGRATLELLNRAEAERVDRIEAGRKLAGSVRLAFEVPDIAAASVSLQNSRAAALNGQVQTPWGHLNQRLQTADGLQLTLFQLSTEKTTAN